MTKIYTKTGDQGQTGLWGGERVGKDDPRVAAYGDVDELNSTLGAAIASLPRSAAKLSGELARVQEELFLIGSFLSASAKKAARLAPPYDRGVPPSAWEKLERAIDAMTAELKPQTKFILPGGSPAAAWLFFARAVCRRAERAVVGLSAKEKAAEGVVVYLNRLSDYLFVAGRFVNAAEKRKETEWQGLS